MTFEEKLRQFLSTKFAHPGQAYKALKVSRVQLSIYLNGRGKPGFAVLRELSKMGCDLNWLINDEVGEPEVKGKNDINEKLVDINEKLVDIIRGYANNNKT